MAITGSFTSSDGTVYPNAYARIGSINVMKEDGVVLVNVYPDQQAREEHPGDICGQRMYTTSRETFDGDTYVLGYEYVKTQEPFIGWVDT